MIRNEQLLQGTNQAIKNALNYLDFAIGSRLDLQVLVSGDQEKEQLEALILQGGKITDVNKAREKANLHPIKARFNEKIVAKEWIELLQENKGVVFVVLNGWNRTKNEQSAESSIDATIERFENIKFDRVSGASNDFFFVYIEEEGSKKKTSAKRSKKAEEEKEETTDQNESK